MNISERDEILINRLISDTLKEDLGTSGDVTSAAVFDRDLTAQARIISKQQGVVAGTYLCPLIYNLIDPSIKVDILIDDGSRLEPGTEICRIRGKAYGICAGERTVLNFLQRLSGIATKTSLFAGKIINTKTRLLDTRKTTPLLRILEKKAVLSGGGFNHRFGLFDMILIKDTHIGAHGSIKSALEKAHKNNKDNLKIEIEVQTYEEFVEAVEGCPDRIMLDNMPCGIMSRCVKFIRSHELPIETEASGNVTEETIADIARTGVDFVSSGAITHSAQALDIHMVIK